MLISYSEIAVNFKPEVSIKTKTLWTLALLTLVCFVFVGCAHPNPLKGHGHGPQSVAGFFGGILHGFTFVFSLIGSLFSSKFTMYEVYNTGFPYNFGFVLGQLLFLGAAASDTESGGGGGGPCSERGAPPPETSLKKPVPRNRLRFGGRLRLSRNRSIWN